MGELAHAPDLAPRAPQGKNRRVRVLFITATRLGDAVLSTGLVEHLRARFPGARFTIACGPVPAGLFARLPGLERVVVIEKRRHDLHWWDLWRELAGTRWDLAVDLRGSAITFLLRARRRVVMRGGRRPGHRLGHLAGTFGLSPPAMPAVWTNAADAARAAALLPAGPPIVALGPTANWAGKVWPAARFVSLFEGLRAADPTLRAAVLAGPGRAEAAMAAPVLEAIPGAIDLRGVLTLPEIAASLQRCALFVGNDSGLMHLAAAAGAPTLGLFGPSRVSEYGPPGPRARAAVAPGPEGEAPIEGLAVETVLAAARALLGEEGRR